MSSTAARSTRVSLREAFAAASRKKKPLLSSKKKKAATRRSIAAALEEEQPEEGQEGLTSTDVLEAVVGMRSASAAAAKASREHSPAGRSAAKPARSPHRCYQAALPSLREILQGRHSTGTRLLGGPE